MCAEAARHEADAAHAAKMACAAIHLERAAWKRAEQHGLNAAHTSRLAHQMGKCSCFVRALVEAEQMNRAFGPRYKW